MRLEPRNEKRSPSRNGNGRVSLRTERRSASSRPMVQSRKEENFTFPPVMVRGGMSGMPLPAQKPGKTRRRYDVALPVPGAEMRLPALPQVHIGWRLVSAAIVAVLAFLLYQLWNSPGYRVNQAEVTGLQRISNVDVNAVLRVEDEPIFALDAAELQKKLEEAFPEFSKVSVSVALRNNVSVNVEERLPILVWHQDGRTVLVDANGVAFPQREQAAADPSLTSVEALSSPPNQDQAPVDGARAQFMPVAMVSAILSMKGQAPEDATIIYDAQHGLGWKAAQGWEVYFGDVSDMGMKLSVYQALVKKLRQDDITPVLISVENVKAPYYRLER
jgi:hypothetical protein